MDADAIGKHSPPVLWLLTPSRPVMENPSAGVQFRPGMVLKYVEVGRNGRIRKYRRVDLLK